MLAIAPAASCSLAVGEVWWATFSDHSISNGCIPHCGLVLWMGREAPQLIIWRATFSEFSISNDCIPYWGFVPRMGREAPQLTSLTSTVSQKAADLIVLPRKHSDVRSTSSLPCRLKIGITAVRCSAWSPHDVCTRHLYIWTYYRRCTRGLIESKTYVTRIFVVVGGETCQQSFFDHS